MVPLWHRSENGNPMIDTHGRFDSLLFAEPLFSPVPLFCPSDRPINFNNTWPLNNDACRLLLQTRNFTSSSHNFWEQRRLKRKKLEKKTWDGVQSSSDVLLMVIESPFFLSRMCSSTPEKKCSHFSPSERKCFRIGNAAYPSKTHDFWVLMSWAATDGTDFQNAPIKGLLRLRSPLNGVLLGCGKLGTGSKFPKGCAHHTHSLS